MFPYGRLCSYLSGDSNQSLCGPTWQVAFRSSVMDFQYRAIHNIQPNG